MYKLIAIDLDGTMLNSYGEVTLNTREGMRNLISNGIEVVVSSGRTIDSIEAIADEIGAENYIIAGNGSIVYDLKNKKNIYEKYISKIKALNIIKICQENSIFFSVYTNKSIIADSLKYNILYYYKENLKKEENKKTKVKIVKDVYEYVENMQDENVMKIIICDDNQSVFKAILRKINEVEEVEILDVSHMSRKIIRSGSEDIPLEYFYTEVTEKNVDKWYAIEFLANKLNIDKDEIIAIGDNVNDRIMIQKCGTGIAMKGSTPKITEIADIITKEENDNDGAIKAIQELIY